MVKSNSCESRKNFIHTLLTAELTVKRRCRHSYIVFIIFKQRKVICCNGFCMGLTYPHTFTAIYASFFYNFSFTLTDSYSLSRATADAVCTTVTFAFIQCNRVEIFHNITSQINNQCQSSSLSGSSFYMHIICIFLHIGKSHTGTEPHLSYLIACS